MSSFWFILKQQWTIEEISIFSNSSHLEWRAGLLDTILKGTHQRTIPARFGLIRIRGFRGEDLNVKAYDIQRTDGRQTPSDGKSSPGQSPGELKLLFTNIKWNNWYVAIKLFSITERSIWIDILINDMMITNLNAS